MEETLSPNSDQEKDLKVKDTPPEEDIATKADNFEDEKKLFLEDEVGELKVTQTESVQVKNTLNSTSNPDDTSEGKNEIRETSSREVNGFERDEQFTTEVPKVNALSSEEHDNSLNSTSNFEGDDIASRTLARDEHSVNSKETNLEHADSRYEINASTENSLDSSGVEGGSHRSPDRKTKIEYRKIKSEVTGEGETSESEGEDSTKDKTEKQLNVAANDAQAKDTWMDILGNGLLKKRVLQEGKGRDTRPDRGQVVTLQVAGRTELGTAVDWNRSLEFILGEGEVIQALDLVVALMELDEVCELVTDPKYAYGEAGKPDGKPPIPPNAKLTYELQLLAVRDGPNVASMTDEEQLAIGEKKREIGNDLYTGGDYAGAINSYQRAIKYLSSSTSEEIKTLRVKCWNNMAAAQLKIKAYSAAEKSCSQVLQVDPDNVKALFRKGKVLAANGETGQALVYVKKADQLDPTNKTIRAELNRLKQLLASEKQSERSMYRRMVGDLTGHVNKKKNRTGFGWSLVFGATVVALGGILMAVYLARH